MTAVQQSLAGVIDWHKPLIGIPRQDLTPLVWKEGGKEKWVVGTRSNVLAVLDGREGEIGEWKGDRGRRMGIANRLLMAGLGGFNRLENSIR